MIDFTIPPDLEEVRARVAAFVRDQVLPVEPEVEASTFESRLSSLRA